MSLKKVWAGVKEDLVQDAPSELGPRALAIAVAIVLVFYLAYVLTHLWQWYLGHVAAATPVGTTLFAGVAAWLTFGQLKVARERHLAQTKADAQRRITDTFSKAAEQLGSEKLAVRLGGIYTLERISLESWRDYWPVMETLCAFARDRSRETLVTESKLPTDIAAVMTVITRRSSDAKIYERDNQFVFDLSKADLRGANLQKLDLIGANLNDVSLQGSYLMRCNFSRSRLVGANMRDSTIQRSQFDGVRLIRADLSGATVKHCSFSDARLGRIIARKAEFFFSTLETADIWAATLTGTYFGQTSLPKDLRSMENTTVEFFEPPPDPAQPA